MFVPSTGGRYFSMFLMTAGSYAPYNLCVSWVSASMPRPRAKRAAALAVCNFMGAGVAHFYTSYMFPDSQAPRYRAGGGVMSGACVVCAAAALLVKAYLRRQNERFEEEEEGEEKASGGGGGGGVVGRHEQISGAARRGDGVGTCAVVVFRYVH